MKLVERTDAALRGYGESYVTGVLVLETSGRVQGVDQRLTAQFEHQHVSSDGGRQTLRHGHRVVTVDGDTVNTLGRREGFGENALIHDVPTTATVTATSPGLLRAIERNESLTALTGHPPGLWSASERAKSLLDREAARPAGEDTPQLAGVAARGRLRGRHPRRQSPSVRGRRTAPPR